MTRVPCLTCGTPTADGPRCPPCEAPRRRARDAQRAKARPELRTWRWRRLSERARERQPFCTQCGATSNLQLDHVVSVAAGGPAFPHLDGVEAQVLCRSCNARKGAGAEQGGDPRGFGVLEPRGRQEASYSSAEGGDVDPEGPA